MAARFSMWLETFMAQVNSRFNNGKTRLREKLFQLLCEQCVKESHKGAEHAVKTPVHQFATSVCGKIDSLVNSLGKEAANVDN